MYQYYLFLVQNKSVCANFGYETLDEALAKFHTELAYRGEGRTSTLCVILDQIGGTIKRDYWERPLVTEEEVSG